MADERKYSEAEVKAILERALKTEPGAESDLDHAELQAIGEQVGVPAEAMTRAAQEVLEARLEGGAALAIKSRRRRWLGLHAGVFALLNGLLFTVNLLTTPGEWWVLFSVFFWGLALALHAGLALGLGPSAAALQRERKRVAGRAPARLRVAASEAATPVDEDVAPSEESARSRGTARS